MSKNLQQKYYAVLAARDSNLRALSKKHAEIQVAILEKEHSLLEVHGAREKAQKQAQELSRELTAKEKALLEAHGAREKAQKQTQELSRELTAKEKALLKTAREFEDLARDVDFKIISLQKQDSENSKVVQVLMFIANPFLYFINRRLMPDPLYRRGNLVLPHPPFQKDVLKAEITPLKTMVAPDSPAVSNPHYEQLAAKEAVIQQLLLERRAWRTAGFLFWPMQRLILKIIKRKKDLTRVRLGELCQHAPRVFSFHVGRMPKVDRPMPTISLVTPSYNQGHFLAQTIQSALGQGYPGLQYVIQDGGSRDNSVEIIRENAQRLHAWESVSDRGQAHAINLGFQKTSGEIMAWLNADDLYTPTTLWRVARFFQRNPEVDVVYGHRLIINEQGQKIGTWIMPEHEDEILSWADYVPQETLFWRRRAWEKAGGALDESFYFAMDWDLLLRFRRAGATMVCLPALLGCFRVHESQKTSQELGHRGKEEMEFLRQRVHGRIPSDAEVWRNIEAYLRKSIYSYWGWRAPQSLKRIVLGKNIQTIIL